MLARVLADAGADGGDGRVLQQRARPAAHRAAGRRTRPATSSWRWARAGSATSPSCARSPRPTSRWCSTSARPTSASSARRSRSRWPRASSSRRSSPDGAAVLNARRPAGRRDGRAAPRPTCGPSAGPPPPTCASATCEVDDLGRASFDLTHEGATEHVALRLLGEHQAINAAATAATALAAGLAAGPASPTSLRAIDRLSPVADGAARARRRPRRAQRRLQRQPRLDARPRWRRSPGWAARRAAHGRGAGGDARARRRAPRRSTAQVGLLCRTELGHRRGRGRRGGRPRRSTTPSSRSAARTARRATSRPSTEAGEWLRENVAGPDVVLVKASRAGRLETGRRHAPGRPDG